MTKPSSPGIARLNKPLKLKALWARRAKRKPLQVAISIDDFSVFWRKSARRSRSLALKVDRAGQIIAMTPVDTSEREVRQFVQKRRAWVKRQLIRHAALLDAKAQAFGETVWFLGEEWRIQAQYGPKNQISHDTGSLNIFSRKPLAQEMLDRRAKKWLRDQANQLLPEYMQSISAQTGLSGSNLQIKSYTARWGSCRHDGIIQLNWKLIMAPREVIDYVIIHELCHLKDFNHSKMFWAQVAQHCPDYSARRQWLKQHGSLLISEH